MRPNLKNVLLALPRDQGKIRAYTRSSSKTFRSLSAEVTWPQAEVVQILKNKSTALNITLENIDHITDQSRVVYAIDDDPGAVLPPSSLD